jgi:photosynthetic reaction center cytochrome c subunit
MESKQMILGVLRGVVVCLAAAGLASGQGAPPRPQMAEEVFKNIQVLKGIPVDEFMDTMGMFAASLSMNCTDCHTEESTTNWEKFAEETLPKRTARRMVGIVNTINSNFGGARSVSCWTCHRGDLRPKNVPSMIVQYGEPFDDPNEVNVFPPSGQPSPDQVFEKYVQAVGGAQRLASITSFAGKGTYEGYDTDFAKVPVEVFAQTPNQRTTVIHALFGDKISTYDGRAGWVSSADKPMPLMPLTGGNLEGARLEGLLFFPAQIKQAFSQWRVTSKSIDDKTVRVLQGTNTGQPPVNLYFDEAGLLVRFVRFVDTAVGRVPTQIDYSDYRDVSGVKMPFRWITTWTGGKTTTELTELLANVAIDAAKFGRPAPAPPAKSQ